MWKNGKWKMENDIFRFIYRYHKTKLKLFDGYISDDYYLNIVNDANSSVNEKDNNDQMVEQILRSGEMLCLGGEEDFDRIMRGDFCAFNRSDCAIRYNEIFRWAWESWHFAVGNEIAPIYSNAIDLMNIGAKQNGNKKTHHVSHNNSIHCTCTCTCRLP